MDKKILLQSSNGQDNLYPIPCFPGIDVSNSIVATKDTSYHSITLNQDAFVYMHYDYNHLSSLVINGVSFPSTSNKAKSINTTVSLFKSGTTLVWQGASGYDFCMQIYGVTY